MTNRQSKIDQLIAELCPNGVEFLELKNIMQRNKGTKITANQMKELHKNDAPVKIFAGGKTFALIDFDDIPEKDIHEMPSVIVKSRGIIEFEYYDKPFSHKNEFWSYFSKDESVNVKYVFYYLKTKEVYFQKLGSKMQMPQISLPDTEKFKIPLPPLAIQQEIVKILDTFTELESELEAELEARNKQYGYYREELLTFGDDLNRTTLGEVCSLITKGTTPSSFEENGISFIKTEAFDGVRINKSKLSYINESTHQNALKRSMLQENDILFTIAGATIGKCAIVTSDILPANTNQALAIIRLTEKVNKKYIFHLLQSKSMKNYIQISVKGSAQPNLNLQQINNFSFPLPPLTEQERIVTILDKFETLVNDISIGLPAELNARRQQYEYYRGKLLTFTEL